MGTLPETITLIAKRARSYRERSRQPGGRPCNEQDTRGALIDPILEALGWDTRDADEVAREYRHERGDNPVDYALKLNGNPCLLLEAKGLGEPMDDRRWIIQILTYTMGADVGWCVLTDGEKYLFYNALAKAPVEKKLFCRVHLNEDAPEQAARNLELLSRASLAKSQIEDRWTHFFVGSRVKSTLQELLGSRNRSLIGLVRKHAPKPVLTPKEIAASFPWLAKVVGSASEEPSPAQASARSGTKPEPKRSPERKQRGGAGEPSLARLIEVGILKPPLRLFRHHKGHDLEARLEADGSVSFRSKTYGTCSSAAEAARAFVSGRQMNTNGWTFWQYAGTDSKPLTLDKARRDYRERAGR